MPPNLALLSTLTGSTYPCLELIFMVPKVFEPLKFDCSRKAQLIIRLLQFLGSLLDYVSLDMLKVIRKVL